MDYLAPFSLPLIIGIAIAFFQGKAKNLGQFVLFALLWAVGLSIAFVGFLFVLSIFGGGGGGGGGDYDSCNNLLGCS